MKKRTNPYDGYASDDFREYMKECREAQRKFGGYRHTDIMGDRCHTVYALKIQERDGSLWVNVGQTKDYHTRVSAKKEFHLKRGAQVLDHRRIKSRLTRREAVNLERRLLNKGFSRTGLPVFGR
jgi:hypothetical protein